MTLDPGIPRSESRYAEVLRQGFPRLRFPEPLESEFRAVHVADSVRWVRLCLLVAIGTSIGFSLIDHLILRSANAMPDAVRYGLQLPVLLICLLVTLRPALARWYPMAVQICGPLYGLGSVLLVVYAPPEHTALIGSRLLLVSIFLFFMCGLRLVQALRCNLVIFAMFVAAGLKGAVPAEIASYLTFAFAISIVIGTAGLFALEHATRTSFLERRLLRELAEQDGLTQLLNRPNFDARARIAWQQAVRRQEGAAVLMIDVDHFKLYNDRYGHQAGDACLRQVAAAVLRVVSESGNNLVARYGGEEFIALLTGNEAAAMSQVAERVVAAVATLSLPHAAAPDHAHVSVSVGCAAVAVAAQDGFEALARSADEALYAAKRRGRNCSVMLLAA